MSLFESFLSQFQKAFIVDSRWKIFLKGFVNTMIITLAAAAIGILIGVVIAVFRYMASQKDPRKKRTFGSAVIGVIDRLMAAYVAVIRGTPLAIQLMIMAFIVLRGVSDGMVVAIVAFGLNSGAYVSEVIRAGIQSVDGGQMEAGRSLGLSKAQTMWSIIFPQAIKNCLPTYTSEFIVLVKETAVVGYIALTDLTKVYSAIQSKTYDAFGPLLIIAVAYFCITKVLSIIFAQMERRLRQSDRR